MFLGYPTPIVTKLANDRDSAIVFLNDIGQIRAYSFDGSSYFYSLSGLFTRIDPNLTNEYEYRGLSIPHLTAIDINGDGRNELIAAYSSPGAVSGLFIYNGRDGQPANGRENAQVLNLIEMSGVAFGDVDDDGVVDVLVSGRLNFQTAKLWLRRGGEEDLPGWPIELEDMESWIANYPVLADLDNDGVPEIIAVYFTLGQSRIFVFKLSGEPFLERPGAAYGEFLTAPFTLSSPAVADINGDGIPELILRSGFIFPGPGFEQVYAFSPSAEIIEGFPITTAAPRQEVFSTVYNPLIDDLDGDGFVEIALIGASNLVSIWDMPGRLSERRWDWPRFMRDEINSATAPPPLGIGVTVFPPRTQISGR
ncbi:MAG: VCBS repeat-containing protein [candidate division Zixibacteria bacterium]|nr:VCBS repeat-containing protein [candidate division Zixibacteria bacterium]